LAVGAWGGAAAGAVHVFERQRGVWHEPDRIVLNDAAAGDLFGHALTLSGGVLAVGAVGAPRRSGNDVAGTGAVFVVERMHPGWWLSSDLDPAETTGARFGAAVGGASDIIVATSTAPRQQMLWGFGRIAGEWVETASFALLNGGVQHALAHAPRRIVLATRFATDFEPEAAIVLFERERGDWVETGAREVAGTEFGGVGGISVHTEDIAIVVGMASERGRMHLLRLVGGRWTELHCEVRTDAPHFGDATTGRGEWVAFGAPGDDCTASSGASLHVYHLDGKLTPIALLGGDTSAGVERGSGSAVAMIGRVSSTTSADEGPPRMWDDPRRGRRLGKALAPVRS
jgi:hypothetical protein